MSQPFLGMIILVPYAFAPRGWAFCNGQILPIAQNTALFSLLGTMYGGNGQTTFALPNLQNRSPMHYGTFSGITYFQGESAGSETETLITSQMPSHSHAPRAKAGGADQASPENNIWASLPGRNPPAAFQSNAPNAPMNPGALGFTPGGLPHNNRQPYLVLNICIAQQGIFPARN